VALVRVTLGCGATPTPGWVNFDNSLTVRLARWPLVWRLIPSRREFTRAVRDYDVRWADATRRIPLRAECAEAVYTSHMIEHFDRWEVDQCLHEIQRILVPGGLLRIAVPDLENYVRDYMQNGDADVLLARTLLCSAKPRSWRERLNYFLIGPRHHHWMYDSRSLVKLLTIHGFENILSVAAGETSLTNPGGLDLFERASDSLYVEARKPLK
jgi:SAM-dependent methyltransferase